MYTPKLKRAQATTISTIDQTIYNSFKSHPFDRKNQSIAPPKMSMTTINENIQESRFKEMRSVSVLDAQDAQIFQKQMANIRKKDEQYSTIKFMNRGNFKKYQLKPTLTKISNGNSWNYPQKVIKLYEQYEKKNQNVNFIKGVLAKSAIMYFAIQNIILFYDIGSSILNQKHIQGSFMKQVQLKSIVYEVKQIEWNFKELQGYKNKNIILLSHPYQFSFYLFQAQLNDGFSKEKQARWMRISPIHSYKIEASQPQKIVVNMQKIYFLDENGTLNQAGLGENNALDRMISGKKQRLVIRQFRSKLTSNHFYRNTTTWLPKTIYHYMKVMGSFALNNLYYSKIMNYDLVQDKQRHLIYTLIDNCSGEASQHSFSKILTCYSTKSNKVIQKCRISQLQFFENELKVIFQDMQNEKSRIVSLQIVEKNYYNQCNLMIVLENGTRLYLKVDQSFKLIYHILPPYLSDKSISKKLALQNVNQAKMKAYKQNFNNFLMEIADKQYNYTCLIWKISQQKDRQSYLLKKSKNTNKLHNSISNTTQSEILMHQAQLRINMKKIDYNQNQERQQKSSIKSYHEYMKGLFNNPELKVKITQKSIEYFYILRPVDVIFNLILSKVTSQTAINKILQEFQKKEILFMFTQIYCDMQGIYVKDQNLIEMMINYEMKIRQNRRDQNIMNFNEFLLLQQRKTNQVSAVRNDRKNNLVQQNSSIIKRKNLSAQLLETITKIQLIFLFKSEGIRDHEIHYEYVQNLLSSSILTYLSRVLTFIWRKKVSEIHQKSIYLFEMMSKLNQLIQSLTNNSAIQSLKIKHTEMKISKSKRMKIMEEFKSKDSQQVHQIQKVNSFINKIQQLIILCSKTKLPIQKSFKSILIIEPVYFQTYIFNFIVTYYSQPIQCLDQIKDILPLFVTESLIKALHIFHDCKNQSKAEVIKIIQYHKKVPSYLTEYLSQACQFNFLQKKQLLLYSQAQSIQKVEYIPKEITKAQIQNLMNSIEQSRYLSLDSYNLNKMNLLLMKAKLYLDRYFQQQRFNNRQIFYHQNLKRVNQIEKDIKFLQLIVKNELKHSEMNMKFDPQTFQIEVLEKVNDPLISIVYYYCYQKEESQTIRSHLNEFYKTKLDKLIEQRSNNNNFVNKIKNIFHQQNDQNIYRVGYQEAIYQIIQTMNFLITKQFDFFLFLQPMVGALLDHAKITKQQSVSMLVNFACILLQNDSHQNNSQIIKKYCDTQAIPLITSIIINSGIDVQYIKEYLIKKTKRGNQPVHRFNQQKFSYVSRKFQSKQSVFKTDKWVQSIYISINALILLFIQPNDQKLNANVLKEYMNGQFLSGLEEKDRQNIDKLFERLESLKKNC